MGGAAGRVAIGSIPKLGRHGQTTRGGSGYWDGLSRMRCSVELIRAFTPVFAGYAERCTAGPGPFQALEVGTVPGLQRTTEEVLRGARDKCTPGRILPQFETAEKKWIRVRLAGQWAGSAGPSRLERVS